MNHVGLLKNTFLTPKAFSLSVLARRVARYTKTSTTSYTAPAVSSLLDIAQLGWVLCRLNLRPHLGSYVGFWFVLRFLRISALLSGLLLCGPVLSASSTIFDGTIETITEHGITVKRSFSPYSSPGILGAMSVKVDGTYLAKFLKATPGKASVVTWYIDDIPVTWETFKSHVPVGTRVTTFENRGFWFYVHASLREHGNTTGSIQAISDESVIVRRVQSTQSPVQDFSVYQQYLFTEVALESDAVAIRGGNVIPAAGAISVDDEVFVQQARQRMRVELVPAGFGDWEGLVRNAFSGRLQSIGSYIGIQTAMERVRKINVGGLHYYQGGKNPKPGMNGFIGQVEKWDANAVTATSWTLNNALGHEPQIIERKLYRNDAWWILDGMWINQSPRWRPMAFPGHWTVAHTRRGRSQLDALYVSSEAPSAWGLLPPLRGILFLSRHHPSLV